MDLLTKEATLKNAGLNSSEWDLEDNGDITPRSISPSPSPTVTPKPTMPGQSSSASGAFGRSALTSALPTATGLGGGALGGMGGAALAVSLGLAPETMGASLIPLVLGLGGAVGGSMLGEKVQEPLISPEFKQQQAEDISAHPIASTLGGFAPAALAFNPVKGLMNLPSTVKAGGRMLGLGEGAVTAGEKANLLNTALNVGTTAGQNIYGQLQGGQDFSPSSLLLNIGMASILNEPSAIGKMVGFHSGQDIDRANLQSYKDEQNRVQALQEAQNTLTAKPESNVDMAQLLMGDRRVPNMASSKQNAMKNYAEDVTAPESQLNNMEAEGGIVTPKPLTDFDRAELQKSQQDLQEQIKAKAELNRQEAAHLASENAGRAMELQKTLEENQAQKGSGMGVGLEVTPKPFELAKPGYEFQPDYSGGVEQANKEVATESTQDLAARKLEGNKGDKYSSESSLPPEDDKPHPFDKLTWEQLPSEFKNKVMDLAHKRGISLEQARSIIDPKTGVEKLGVYSPSTREAKISSTIGRGDTGPHEIQHGFFQDLKDSPHKADNDLYNRGLAIYGGDEAKAEEALTSTIGGKTYERLTTNNKFGQFFKDFISRWKNNLGMANDEDVIRHLSQRLVTDVPRGMRGEIPIKPNYIGTQLGGATPLKLYNLLEDIKDSTGKVVHPKGSTVSEPILEKYGVKHSSYSELDPRAKDEYARLHTEAMAARQEKEQNPKDSDVSNNLIDKELALKKFEEDHKFSSDSTLDKAKEEPIKKPFSIPFLKPEIEKIRSNQGAEGELIANSASDFYEKFRENKGLLTNDVVGKLREHLNLLNPSQLATQNNEKLNRVRQYMDNVADGKPGGIVLTPEEKKIEGIIRENMLKTLAEKNKRPELPSTIASDTYFPQVVSRSTLNTLLNKPNTSEASRLIQDFKEYREKTLGETPEEAKNALKIFKLGYESSFGGKDIASQFGPIDKSAGVGIPQSWRETNLIDRMARFNNRYARRLAYHDAFENKPEVTEALSNPETGIANSDVVKTVLSDIQGRRENDEAKRTAISGVIRAGMLGPLTGAKDFVSNLTLGLQHQSPSQSVQSIAYAWSNMKNNIADSFETGVNRHNISSIEFGDGGIEDATNILRATRDILNEVQGRNILERLSRATAFGQGKFLAMDNLAAKSKGSISGQGKKFLEDFGKGIDFEKTISPEDINRMAARYVESVQGTYDYRGLPSVAQKGSLAPVLSLAKWNIEKFNNFVKYNIDPAKSGNFTPLLMSTLGMLIGGEAVNKLVEEITGRKERTPKLEELASAAKSGNNIALPAAYKLAALSSLSGYAGIMGDLTKAAFDAQFKNKVQGYNNPLIDGVSQGFNLMGDVVEALKDGDLNIGADAISKVLETYFQTYRLALGKLSEDKKGILDKSNKMRDLKVFKSLNDLPVPDSSATDLPNPFINKEQKTFKSTDDLKEAANQLPTLISKAIEDSKGVPEILKSKLEGLKLNSYQTMPSPESMPMTFMKYITYLEETQGKEKATERLVDYMKQNFVNKAKAKMIPNL